MKSYRTTMPRAPSERGQTFLVIVVFIAVFLLGILGLATDYSQVWAHRQMAQGAADAACQAGAADLFLNAFDPSAGLDFSWIGSPYTCNTHTGSPPCKYAQLNGYSGSGVSVSFPSALPGVPPISGGFGTIAHPYIRVTVSDTVLMSFTKTISSIGTVNVAAKAGCGMNPVSVPIPILVLHQTAASSLSVQGSGTIQIIGGPNRSIQVDSNNSAAVSVGGSSTINLTQAGPSGTGADFGVFGNEAQPGGVSLGTGKWVSPSVPFGDAWITIPTPSVPGSAGTATPVPFALNGCPDPAGCVEFTAGNYTGCSTGTIAPGANGCLMVPYSGSNPKFSSGGPDWQVSHAYAAGALIQPTSHNTGNFVYQALNAGTSATTGPNPWNQTIGANQPDNSITWKNLGVDSKNPSTAIFDPGLYYVGANGLSLKSGSIVRPSTANGDGNSGITFYFSTSATVSTVADSGSANACTSASSGSATPPNCVVSYKVDGTASTAATGSILSRKLQCPAAGSPPNPSQVPALIDGNILLGPCSGTYGDSAGQNRGFVFFQSHANAGTASWGGGSGSLVSGFLYFHATNYSSQITMSGGSSSTGLSLGNIVSDMITLKGGSGIKLILNPLVAFQVLRAQLLE